MLCQSLSSEESQCPNNSSVGGVLDACTGLAFDSSVMRRTVVTDFGLVCDRQWLVPLISSSYMAGV